jgi:hypothetical protein
MLKWPFNYPVVSIYTPVKFKGVFENIIVVVFLNIFYF